MKIRNIFTVLCLTMGMAACGGGSSENGATNGSSQANSNDITNSAEGTSATDNEASNGLNSEIKYGLYTQGYELVECTIEPNETVGKILNKYGVSAARIDKLDKAAKEVFSLSKLRAGNTYTLFTTTKENSEGEEYTAVDYMVYHINKVEYVIYDISNDTPAAIMGTNPREAVRKRAEATITSSLWNAIVDQGLSYSLAAEFEDMYQWTVDFFHIQEGDGFVVIYDDLMVDGQSVGIGTIWGAKFVHKGKEYYAIPFVTEGNKMMYWEYNGESLRKGLLKAPLKYSRISSTFTYKRLHPVHKVYKPHTGVDYAAPMGTPVHSVADGEIIFAGWGGGGGNTIKIRHSGGLQTGYLHLKSFAKGIAVGKRVAQGDVIGYVGSTGTSTGPHLDYRMWQNGTPIDPLKVTQQPADPIDDKYRADFENVRDRMVAEIEGTEIVGGVVTKEDIFQN